LVFLFELEISECYTIYRYSQFLYTNVVSNVEAGLICFLFLLHELSKVV